MTDSVSTHVITPGPGGALYLDGPWSLVVDEIISLVVPGGSKISNWIPNRPVNTKFAEVAHLTWLAPTGMDGSESYGDYLAGLEPRDVCEFGDETSTWQTCEYRIESARITSNSDKMNLRNLNYREFERSPILTVRGPVIGAALNTDWDWALARAGQIMHDHLDWNYWYGDPTAFTNTSPGLDSIIRVGYVKNRKVGPGACDNTDPLVWSGAGRTIEQIVVMIRRMFRTIAQRAADRNYRITSDDIVVIMSASHWNVIADFLAANGTLYSAAANVVLNSSIRELRAERRDITTPSGLYDGYIPLPEFNLPVMVDNLLGRNITVGLDSRPAVIGDIFMLTRRFAGMMILEEQWLNYNTLLQANNYIPDEELFTQQNGMLLVTYLKENNICFSYAAETERRIVSKMQHLQGRINDVVVETETTNTIEHASFTGPNYYAYEGGVSGIGNVLITGLK